MRALDRAYAFAPVSRRVELQRLRRAAFCEEAVEDRRREVTRRQHAQTEHDNPMLAPGNAWRILENRTGGRISRAQWYRWLQSGRVFSIRIGHRRWVPWKSLEELIADCLAGKEG